jgi:cell wall-associated NlpC family hydrolase
LQSIHSDGRVLSTIVIIASVLTLAAVPAGSAWGAKSAPPCEPAFAQTATTVGQPASFTLGTVHGLPDDDVGRFADIALNADQVRMAGTITAVGKQMGITRRGIEIGLAVAMEQSSLTSDAENGRWLGLFQQHPDSAAGLYTQYPRTDPSGAAWMFFDQLSLRVPGYDGDPRPDWQIGEAVQETNTGEFFGQYQAMAESLADLLIDSVTLTPSASTCTSTPATSTMGGSEFDPGNIISDGVFYDSHAMSVDQIRSFIGSTGADCTGVWCLKNLVVDSPEEPADRYCAAYPGGTGEDAATVIARVAVACGVNPQVMLVTLQKESGLLSRANPSSANYNAAWGWHCPDTGPDGSADCDPAYAGFFNQGYGMAKQWSRYRNDPEKYRYHAGETVDIPWNIAESNCGAAPVTIENTATASLYNYTPYQPNAASLTGYPGQGDGCSTYGNRNFFYMFVKYFGSTGGGSSTARGSTVLTDGPSLTIPDNPYVPAELVGQSITAPNSAVASGLAAGLSVLGMPYVWGGGGSGAGPNNGCARGGGANNSCGAEVGFDCSGLTAYVLQQAGFQIPGDSGSQRAGGTVVARDDALPGDIVGFPGHVAIFLGTFAGRPYILEASGVGIPIHVVPLSRHDTDDQMHRYWTAGAGAPSI